MRLLQKRFFLITAIGALLLLPALVSAAQINEIRIDQSGADNDEYFELAGQPGESLDGLTYIVIGDGAGACGVVECVVPLDGYTIQADGLVSFGEATATLFTPDVTLAGSNPLNFENSDNVTHMLVRSFSGALNDDLDTDDDGVLDTTPWSAIVDCVAMVGTAAPDCVAGDRIYCSTVVGPDGSFVPGHIYLCSEGWRIGPFDPSVGKDTPGDGNDCTVAVEQSTWSNVKNMFK